MDDSAISDLLRAQGVKVTPKQVQQIRLVLTAVLRELLLDAGSEAPLEDVEVYREIRRRLRGKS